MRRSILATHLALRYTILNKRTEYTSNECSSKSDKQLLPMEGPWVILGACGACRRGSCLSSDLYEKENSQYISSVMKSARANRTTDIYIYIYLSGTCRGRRAAWEGCGISHEGCSFILTSQNYCDCIVLSRQQKKMREWFVICSTKISIIIIYMYQCHRGRFCLKPQFQG